MANWARGIGVPQQIGTHGGDSSTTDEASPRYAGWRVVFACFMVALFAWGFGFYGHGIYLVELQRAHGWPASLIAGASTAYYLFSAMLVVFVSDAVRTLGPRRFVLAGTAFMAASAALLAVINAPWQLFAAYLMMSFGWAAMSAGGITNVLGLWFDRKRGLAISLALSGASFGGVIITPALVFAISVAGFPAAIAGGVGLMLLILLPTVLVTIGAPPAARDDGSKNAAQSRSTGSSSETWTRAQALRSLAFWTASAPFALGLMAQVGFLVHQIAFLDPIIGRAQAGIAVAVTTTAAVIGRVGLGLAVDWLDQRRVAAASLASQAGAFLVMSQTTDAAALFLACAVFGFSVGNIVTLPPLILQREFAPSSFGMLVGLSTAIGQFTFSWGPGLLGLLRDATGNYTAALVLCVVVDLIAAGVVLVRLAKRTP
jgi:MFS family permease